jgi:predicted membrane-bound spermidine synthase
MKPDRLLPVFFGLFAVSGFSGLIYESIWSHYLKLYLGHAAYAQALVLAIFMGGMSLGAWLCALRIHRVGNALRAYALVEGTIGLVALVFDSVFRGMTGFVLEGVFGHVDSVAVAQAIKWTSAALLILPQSVLLGATFPLMSNGLLRRYRETPGRMLGMLYFTNSIGGAAGVLTSGFLLIGVVGLPGTMLTAGIINLLLAIIVYGLAKAPGGAPLRAAPAAPAAQSNVPSFILLAALITGLSSFIYEIVWIRMLSMILGASTHAFELMLSAFITGLAIGGLIVRNRAPSGRAGLQLAAYIQILMGLAAFATLALYDKGFDLMGYFMSAIARNDDGYPLFILASHGIALAAMLPATILAGMTLPLFTAILMDRGQGERSVGQVYAFNTLGAIAGTVLTLFLLMPLVGVEHALLAGAGLDVAIGIVFLVLAARAGGLMPRAHAAFASAAVVVLALMSFLSAADPRRMASGVFRTGEAYARSSVSVPAHYDGSTASVTVLRYVDDTVSIFTNGKPDASASMDPDAPTRTDEPTMVLTAALPLSIKPDARRVAIVGFGAGISTHTILGSQDVERVDTIEIERAMYEGARNFGIRSERAYTDPRSNVLFEDAKTFFYQRGEKYDLIISEPSNPWVSGVSSLFTTEYYRMARGFLTDDGVLGQWLHAYETNDAIVHSILKALAENFADFHVYATNSSDLVIVASMRPGMPLPGPEIFRHDALRKDLARVDVRSEADLRARFLADKSMLAPILEFDPVPVNSDYFPYVDLHAAKTVFTRRQMDGLHRMRTIAVPLMLAFRPELLAPGQTFTRSEHVPSTRVRDDADMIASGQAPDGAGSNVVAKLAETGVLAGPPGDCAPTANAVWEHAMLELMMSTVGYLDGERLGDLRGRVRSPCAGEPTANQSALIGLLEAYAIRDFGSIAQHAGALLEAAPGYSRRHRELLAASLWLGLAAAGRNQELAASWEKWMPKVFGNVHNVPYPLLLLHANAAARTPD